ncbi:MAG TPA: CBS domain-containing protein [Pseudonocardiaceae bacterium]|nr:CBS domain-containing protein [Pseudonocardiaceae bacterium]
MTKKVVTTGPHSTVREAAKWLSSHGFTALPVVDSDDVLLGIVTEADVVRDRFPRDARALLADRAAGSTETAAEAAPATVGEIMSTPAMALPAGTDIAEVAKYMLRHQIRSLPIVDGKRLVGIITRRDLVRCLARTDAEIAADVRRRLEVYGGPDRWSLRVRQGHVTMVDSLDDPVDAHVAKIIALSVPGVEFAKVLAAGDGPTAMGSVATR